MSIIVLELCGHKHTIPPLCWEQTDVPVWAADKAGAGIPGHRSWALVAAVARHMWCRKLRSPPEAAHTAMRRPCPELLALQTSKSKKMSWSKTRNSGRCRDFHKTPKQGRQKQLCPLCTAHRLPWLSSERFSGELSLGYCMLWNSSCKAEVQFWLRHLSRWSGLLWDLYTSVSVLKSLRKLFWVNLL